jgi:two-component system KDP operon response regulator KdpE
MKTELPVRILLVEDDMKSRIVIEKALEDRGYRPIGAETVDRAMKEASFGVDLLLLDLGLPDGDGYDVIKFVRTRFSIPIIVISGRQRESEKVQALDYGADDYLEKPFGTEELFARIRALLRRTGHPSMDAPTEIVLSGLCLDVGRRVIRYDGAECTCTPTEGRILKMLLEEPTSPLSSKRFLEKVWDRAWPGQDRSLKVHISNLRKKVYALTKGRIRLIVIP